MSASLPDIADLARRHWGEPNKSLSNNAELRYGTNGSKSVRIKDRTWFDHEADKGGGYADLHEAVLGSRPADAGIVATYDYVDASGKLLYQVCRKSPKTFLQRRPLPDGKWEWNTRGVQRVPYRLPELLRAAADTPIFICEGEKDADALRDRLLVATTNAGGAGKWDPKFAAHFRGRHVVILPDNDEAGELHAQDVERKLRGACASVCIVRLPDLPPKGDVSDWLAASGTGEALELLAEQNFAAPRTSETSRQHEHSDTPVLKKPGELTVLTPADCENDNPRPYVIKGLVAQSDHAQMIGPPGSGKSALAPLAGYCIALDLPFLGRRVRKGTVIYLAAEDGHGMKLRVRALRKQYGDAPNFLLVPDPIDLMDADSGDLESVFKLIRDHEPAVIFIDTIARAFPGLRENDSDSMGRVVHVIRQITQFGCKPAVISLHHVAKDAGTTPRGHGILAGDLDAVLLIQGEKADTRTVTMGKNRNGPSEAAFAFNIGSVEFGLDADLDPIVAPIAEPIEISTSTRKAEREAKLGDPAALMLREIRDLIDRNGEMLQPGDGYPLVLSITRAALRSRLVNRGWFADNLLSTDAAGRTTLARPGYSVENVALKALKRRSIVSHNRTHVWLV